MLRFHLAALYSAAALASPVSAQTADHSHMDHSGMVMPDMDRPAKDEPPAHDHSGTHTAALPFSAGSGTARLPGAEPHGPAFHLMAGDWMAMLHGTVSAQYTSASGPRGADKLYSTSMLMGSLGRDTAWGKVAFRAMASHEPMLSRDGYPNLFATGETAYGQPLIDRQHPHDLFMELSGRVDVNIAPGTTLFVYGGPVGEPALGPSFFMMRGSALWNPEPPIAHHWFDSTHIAYGVATAGVSNRLFQLEASAFRGREPDERRWNIEGARFDSWSVRATLNPSPRWAIQASFGRIKEPEVNHPGEDERRLTASAHYADGRRLSAMLGFSAKTRIGGETLTAWLAEGNWNPDQVNTLFGRAENVANDELFPDHNAPDHEHALRVTKLQAGYVRRIPVGLGELGLGASAATFFKPARLDTAYGRSPVQVTVFVRLRLGR